VEKVPVLEPFLDFLVDIVLDQRRKKGEKRGFEDGDVV